MMVWFILILMMLILSNRLQPKKYVNSMWPSLLLAFETSLLISNELPFLLFITLNFLVFILLYHKNSIFTFLFNLKTVYLFLFSTSFLFCLFEFMTQVNLSMLLNEEPLVFFLLILSVCLLIWIIEYKMFIQIKDDHWDYIFETMHKGFIFLILILLMTKKIAFIFVLLYTKHSYEISLILFLALCLELFFDISFVNLINKSYDLSLHKHEHKILKLQYEVQANYYEQLESYQHNLRKIAHDVHHHKLVLHHYLEEEKYVEALAYLNDYSLLVEKHELIQLCAHPILNALLLKKQQQCLQDHIEFHHDIKLPASLAISDFDLCILIGNLLDNALEACLKVNSPQPFIRITAQIINDHYTFKIENTSLTSPIKKDHLFQTTKVDKLSHGLGLSNVERVIDQYDGMINYQIQDSQFNVMVAVPI